MKKNLFKIMSCIALACLVVSASISACAKCGGKNKKVLASNYNTMGPFGTYGTGSDSLYDDDGSDTSGCRCSVNDFTGKVSCDCPSSYGQDDDLDDILDDNQDDDQDNGADGQVPDEGWVGAEGAMSILS